MRFKRILLIVFLFVFACADANKGFTIKTVVIDAGHGGKDPGAIGPDKINEKDVALQVALKLGDAIQKNFPDVNVIYTRKTDVFIELHERADIANKNKADLFIAIHCNSSPNAEFYGTSTYVLGLHRTEANLEVAKRENSVILLEEDRDKNYEFDPNSPEGHIIMSMKQNAYLDQSIDMASKIESQFELSAKRKSLGVKQAGFYVLYKTTMPSLLSEIGFISNPDEEKFLNSAKGEDQIASALFSAFKNYKSEMESSEGQAVTHEEDKKTETAPVEVPSKTADKQEPKTVKSDAPDTKNTSVPQTPPVAASTNDKTNDQTRSTTVGQGVVTTSSGKKIRKPIENGSGGGKYATTQTPQTTTNANKPVVAENTNAKTAPDNTPVKQIDKPVAENKTETKVTTTANKTEVTTVEKKAETNNTVPATKTVTETKTTTRAPKQETKTTTETKPEVKTTETKTETKISTPAPKEETKNPVVAKPEVKSNSTKTETKTITTVSKEAAPHKTEGGIVFKIQLCALKSAFKEQDDVTKWLGEVSKETLPNGFIRYFSGETKSYAQVKKNLALAIGHGYKDAFIVGLKDGKRMSPDQMKALGVQ